MERRSCVLLSPNLSGIVPITSTPHSESTNTRREKRSQGMQGLGVFSVCLCSNVYMDACLYVCTCVCACVCEFVCVCICTVYIYICVCVCVSVCVRNSNNSGFLK